MNGDIDPTKSETAEGQSPAVVAFLRLAVAIVVCVAPFVALAHIIRW
jgi:hypothetical protein